MQVLGATGLTDGSGRQAFQDIVIGFEFDGGGAVLPVGLKARRKVPFGYTIVGWDILAEGGTNGTVTFDVNTSTYANYPTTASIATSNKPAIASSGVKATMSTLSGWTVDVPAGMVIEAEIDAVTAFQRVVLSLTVRKTS